MARVKIGVCGSMYSDNLDLHATRMSDASVRGIIPFSVYVDSVFGDGGRGCGDWCLVWKIILVSAKECNGLRCLTN